jgi:hypothetical protein
MWSENRSPRNVAYSAIGHAQRRRNTRSLSSGRAARGPGGYCALRACQVRLSSRVSPVFWGETLFVRDDPRLHRFARVAAASGGPASQVELGSVLIQGRNVW